VIFADDMTAPPAEPVAQIHRPAPVYFWYGVAILGLWIGFIAWLTFNWSNPVTLNPRQLLESDVILFGRVVSIGTIGSTPGTSSPGIVEPVPDQKWPFPDFEPIQIGNLAETKARPGESYLFPLKRASSKRKPAAAGSLYLVTPTELPDGQALIYPATLETREQYEKLLNEKPFRQHGSIVLPPSGPTAHD